MLFSTARRVERSCSRQTAEITIRFNLIGHDPAGLSAQGNMGARSVQDARPRVYPFDEAWCFASAGTTTAMLRFLK